MACRHRPLIPKFPISNYELRLCFDRRITLLLLLVFLAPSCQYFHPKSLSESDRQQLADLFRSAIADSGGTQVWIKHARHAPGHAEAPLQALATPTAYEAVQLRVRQEADKAKVDLDLTVTRSGGHPACFLKISQRGQNIIQIQLREVPRLLRAVIVIDDMGRDMEAAHKLLALDYSLTFSILPHLPYSRQTAQEVHHDEREVMLHLPMEPEASAHTSPGEGALLVGMNDAEVQEIVANDLATVPFVAGVNNHMGSRATQDAALMADLMKILAQRRLYFIDSRTTGASAALQAAQRRGLPSFYRSVFLDNTESVDYTLGQLREFQRKVEQEGVALAIGHPHPTTITALAKFLPEMDRADIEIVSPSQIVRLPEIARLHPAAAATKGPGD